MATEAPKTETKEAVVEKQTNCLACNKPMKRIKRYYRNGKYYCSKKCWLKALKSKDKDKEAK